MSDFEIKYDRIGMIRIGDRQCKDLGDLETLADIVVVRSSSNRSASP